MEASVLAAFSAILTAFSRAGEEAAKDEDEHGAMMRIVRHRKPEPINIYHINPMLKRLQGDYGKDMLSGWVTADSDKLKTIEGMRSIERQLLFAGA